MSPAKGYSREDIIRHLQEFERDSGRPPKTNEPGLEGIVQAAKREFGSWEHAMKIAGLQTYKAWRRRRTLGGEMHRLLNNNPLTLVELRKELVKNPVFALKLQSVFSVSIFQVAKQSSDIKSMGQRRTKIYYLEGQEALAQTRLDAIMSEIPPLEEEIFYHLRQPMTRVQIEKLVSGDRPSSHEMAKLLEYLKELELAGLVYRARFVGRKGHGRSRRFTSYELFGELATRTFYCRFDCPNEVAQLVAENIPHIELMDKDMKFSIAKTRSRHLRRILPENVCRILDNRLWEGLSN
jgi:hypothetical protein